MKKYFRVYQRMTANSFQTILSSRVGVSVFLFGKFFRFGLYLAFIYFLFSQAPNVAGFNRNQILLFLLSFTFLGALGQMFFREAYRFRGKLISGEFDFDLVKPIHPLFKNLAGGFDLLDLLTMPVLVFALVKVITINAFTPFGLLLYSLLLLNGFLIMLSIHVLVIAFGIVTTEVDHAMMVYRDLETMGRFPVDIYKEPLRQILTFVVPIGIMFTVPVRALLGLLSWPEVLLAFVVGLVFFFVSLRLWGISLRLYTSASS